MKYVVIGTPMCGYCRQSKAILERAEADFEYLELSEIAPEEQERLMKVAGKEFRSVPQIFTVEDEEWKYLGGHSELLVSLK